MQTRYKMYSLATIYVRIWIVYSIICFITLHKMASKANLISEFCREKLLHTYGQNIICICVASAWANIKLGHFIHSYAQNNHPFHNNWSNKNAIHIVANWVWIWTWARTISRHQMAHFYCCFPVFDFWWHNAFFFTLSNPFYMWQPVEWRMQWK